MFWLQQQRNTIFPGASTQGQLEAAVAPAAGFELLSLAARGGIRIAAQFGAAPDSNLRPTVIYFYGNGACLARSGMELRRFRNLGVNIIIPEYAGFGLSEGAPSERGCYAAADAAYDYLLGRADIDCDRIVAAGRSLGAAVAVDLASRRHLAGLALISAFTRMRDMARRVAPWNPSRFLLRQHFDNLAKIPAVSCPILIAHGTQDSLVPLRMAEQLADAARSAKVIRFDMQGVGHSDIFEIGGDEIWSALGGLLGGL
jgi:uncharacterized protein